MKKVLCIVLAVLVLMVLSSGAFAYDPIKRIKECDKITLLELIDKTNNTKSYKKAAKNFDCTIEKMGAKKVNLKSVCADAYARRVLRLVNVYTDILLTGQDFDFNNFANHVLIDRLVELQRIAVDKKRCGCLSTALKNAILERKNLVMADQIYPDLIYEE
jgi:hypothetical protein